MPFDPNAAAAPDSGVFGLPFSPDDSKIVLVPVPFEATTSYGGGTSDGPSAILEASKQVDLFDLDTGKPYEAGISMLDESAEVRAWNDEAKAAAKPIIESGGLESHPAALATVNSLSEKMNQYVYETTKQWIGKRKIVGVIGGDHSTPFGAIKAYAEAFPGLGVLHLDAHADLRIAYEGFQWSHASIMDNVLREVPQVARLVQVGIRDFCEQELDSIRGSDGRVVTHFDGEWQRRRACGETFDALCRETVDALPRDVYVSFDIDGLDPSLCPHTGTPVPGGLTFGEAVHLVNTLVQRGRRIVGFDLVEVVPGDDEWDANVAARLLYKMCGAALAAR